MGVENDDLDLGRREEVVLCFEVRMSPITYDNPKKEEGNVSQSSVLGGSDANKYNLSYNIK